MAVKTQLSDSQATLDDSLPKQLADQDLDKYLVFLRDGETMIGVVGTNRWSEQGMEVGYGIIERYWGKGYATEAFEMFLDLFWLLPERKDMQKLVAKVHPDNAASKKVLQKVGAREGEIIKRAYSRYLDHGIKSDDCCWYLERPESEAQGET